MLKNLITIFQWMKHPRKQVFIGLLILLFGLTALYRFYQPITHPALLQFDIFDWMTRSREILVYGHMQVPTTLWVFPTINALAAKLMGGDLFSVYLFGGAFLTTFNILILVAIARLLWPKRHLPVLILVFFYAVSIQLLPRSVNYLPEAMTYTFGLALLYFYLKLFLHKTWKVIPVILVLTYLFYHLHQSGLNFIVFSVCVLFAYSIWVVPLQWRWRIGIMFGSLLLLIGCIILSASLRSQFVFFLQGSANADVAFQGDVIPLRKFFSDYPLPLISFTFLGLCTTIWSYCRKTTLERRLSYSLLTGIALFYFAFLYILPNLNIYSLIPWRFYTWFSLYVIFIATLGAVTFFDNFRKYRRVVGGVLILVTVTMVHGNYLPDNMFTADRNTLQSIEKAGIPEGSTVLTTNANHLQTRYSFVGQELVIREIGSEFFRAGSAKAAVTFMRDRFDGRPTYVLISKFQLRQRPSSIDYWRNSALFDMDISKFGDARYFKIFIEDENIAVYKFVNY